MKVRPASPAHIPGTLEVGRALVEESPRYQDFNERKAIEYLQSLVWQTSALYLVALDEDEVVRGFLLAELTTPPFSDQIRATERFFGVHPQYRSLDVVQDLLGQFIAWGYVNRVSRLIIGTSSGIKPDLAKRLYESLGFKTDGYLLSMEVEE